MENINTLNISKVARQVIERYVGKKDYVVRIRVNKKDKNNKVEIIVYYDGRKSFEVKGDKLALDGAYFFLKGNKEFNSPTEMEIEILKALGFSFKMGSEVKSNNPLHKEGYKYRFYVEPSSAKEENKNSYSNFKEEIKEKMDIIKNALKTFDEEIYHVCDEDNINSFYTKKSDTTIDYFELQKILEVGIKNTVEQKGIKKIKLNEKMEGTKTSYTETEYQIIDAIMKERIKAYNDGLTQELEQEDDEEYIVEKNEKSYQQLLMNKMFDKEERNKLLAVDNCPFKNSSAYEMEYHLYSDNRKNRNRKTKKGRVDNIFIDCNKVLFTELKYNEKVIDGTNGIHKHLIDLINGFEKNKEALEEIYDYVCDYNEVLSYFENKNEFIIPDVDRFKDEAAQKEFVIICGYHNDDKRKDVYDKLEKIYPLTGTEAGVKKEYEIELDGEKIHLENQTTEWLITLLKNRYNCETKIFLVDNDYTKFETYPK